MLALTWCCSWNTQAAQRFLLAVVVLVAALLVTAVAVMVLAPVVMGCCSFVVANAWQLAMVPVVFAGAMAVKP